MNLADPELELIDPTPNIHSLFVHFDTVFFWTALVGRALVRWSKRMYSCAGICSYEGRNGICDIALSEPLLKLRPRKDLVETLLHEMIHAFLFITNKDNDRDGHGPNFQAHMHRINKAAGLNISIYHDFHDEVKLYLRHWWRCNGPCQKMKPYFGIVRRSANRAPGPADFWWADHKRKCNGTFIKIKEPEKNQKASKKVDKVKNTADITKYVNNNNDKTVNKNKDKFISASNNVIKKIQVEKAKVPPPVNVHTGNNLTPIKTGDQRQRSKSNSVAETVRNVWLNKQLPINTNAVVKPNDKINKLVNQPSATKIKAVSTHVDSPPRKIKKIDDYYKPTSILQDIYGENIRITQSDDGKKLKAVMNNNSGVNIGQVEDNLVECPSCNVKVNSKDINRHLDECLNKELIETLTKDHITIIPSTSEINRKKSDVISKQPDKPKSNLKDTFGFVPEIPVYKIKTEKDHAIANGKIEQTVKEEPTTPIKKEPDIVVKTERDDLVSIKSEPSTSKNIPVTCPCCGKDINTLIEIHLDECFAFFNNDTTIPEEGSSSNTTIVIDDEDDEFDESQTFNATGTKSPCPCCLKMVEIADMNDHLDICLGS